MQVLKDLLADLACSSSWCAAAADGYCVPCVHRAGLSLQPSTVIHRRMVSSTTSGYHFTALAPLVAAVIQHGVHWCTATATIRSPYTIISPL